jgi:hypothetical protein
MSEIKIPASAALISYSEVISKIHDTI